MSLFHEAGWVMSAYERTSNIPGRRLPRSPDFRADERVRSVLQRGLSMKFLLLPQAEN